MTVHAVIFLAVITGIQSGLHPPVLSGGKVNGMRGIWAECQGRNSTLSSRRKIEEMFRRLEKANLNTVFMQVYRGNKAWYRSSLADSSPYRNFYEKEKVDPLRLATDLAHKRGMRLHAWVNTFRIWGNREARVIDELGKEVVTRDSGGRSHLDYARKELPDGGYWLDPGDPKARAYILAVIDEIIERYPDVDGIHLDYTRYPFREGKGADFGYGRASVERFIRKHGFNPVGCRGSKRALWDEWRREQVTEFIRQAKKLVEGRGKSLSVATLADTRKALSVAFQDWPLWVREGLVDFIVPMNYSSDRKLVKRRSASIVKSAGDREKIAIGLGVYKVLDSPGELLLQVDDCRGMGVAGVVLFSYDNITRRPELFSFLGEEVFLSPAAGN